MDAVASLLMDMYASDRTKYALISVAAMFLVGTVLGLIMDLLGRWLGVDTTTLHHHREKVHE